MKKKLPHPQMFLDIQKQLREDSPLKDRLKYSFELAESKALNRKDSRPLLEAVKEMEKSIISGWEKRGVDWLMHRKLKHTLVIEFESRQNF